MTAPTTSANTLALWLTAARAPSLTATLMPALLTLSVGHALSWSVRGVLAASATIAVLLLQLTCNLLNDVEDDRRQIDQPGTFGGSGVIQNGTLGSGTLKRVAYGSLALAVLIGLPAFFAEPQAVLATGALGVFGALFYSSPKVGLKYRALGDLSVLLLCGPVLTLGIAAVAFGTSTIAPHLATLTLYGAAFGWFAVGILHVNNLQDMQVDARAGALTLARVIGERGSRVYLVTLYALAFSCLIIATWHAGLPLWAALPSALIAIPTTRFVSSVLRAQDLQAAPHALIRITAAQLHLLFGITMTAGVWLAVMSKHTSLPQ